MMENVLDLMKKLGVKKAILVKDVNEEEVKVMMQYYFEEYFEQVYKQFKEDAKKSGDDKKLFLRGYKTHFIYMQDMSFTFFSVNKDLSDFELMNKTLDQYKCLPVVQTFDEWVEICNEIAEERKGADK